MRRPCLLACSLPRSIAGSDLKQSRFICPENGATHSGVDPLSNMTTKRLSYRHGHSQTCPLSQTDRPISSLGNSLIKAFVSDDSNLCQADKALQLRIHPPTNLPIYLSIYVHIKSLSEVIIEKRHLHAWAHCNVICIS